MLWLVVIKIALVIISVIPVPWIFSLPNRLFMLCATNSMCDSVAFTSETWHVSVICTLQLILKGEPVKSLSSIQPKLRSSLCLCVDVCAHVCLVQNMHVRVYVCVCRFVDVEANTTCRMLKDQSALIQIRYVSEFKSEYMYPDTLNNIWFCKTFCNICYFVNCTLSFISPLCLTAWFREHRSIPFGYWLLVLFNLNWYIYYDIYLHLEKIVFCTLFMEKKLNCLWNPNVRKSKVEKRILYFWLPENKKNTF